MLIRNLDEMMMTSVRAGREIPLEDRLRYRFESAQVVRRCALLCDELMPLLSGRAIYVEGPMRAFSNRGAGNTTCSVP